MRRAGVVSNTSSMPEVAGDAALLVTPTDGCGYRGKNGYDLQRRGFA
jgi:hypothetical protein